MATNSSVGHSGQVRKTPSKLTDFDISNKRKKFKDKMKVGHSMEADNSKDFERSEDDVLEVKDEMIKGECWEESDSYCSVFIKQEEISEDPLHLTNNPTDLPCKTSNSSQIADNYIDVDSFLDSVMEVEDEPINDFWEETDDKFYATCTKKKDVSKHQIHINDASADLASNVSNNTQTRKKHFQRFCPSCGNVINVRRHFCNCGYSFKDAKCKKDAQREAHYKEMGRRAANHQNLYRSFKAMKKYVSKLQGGGYQVAVIYFKVSNQNTTKGMLPGSGLSSKNEKNLTKLFYLAHMQDNGSNVNKINKNDVDRSEEIMKINEARDKNGVQEDKSPTQLKKKLTLSQDTTAKAHMQDNGSNVNKIKKNDVDRSEEIMKINEARDKNGVQEDKSPTQLKKKQRLSQDTTAKAYTHKNVKQVQYNANEEFMKIRKSREKSEEQEDESFKKNDEKTISKARGKSEEQEDESFKKNDEKTETF